MIRLVPLIRAQARIRAVLLLKQDEARRRERGEPLNEALEADMGAWTTTVMRAMSREYHVPLENAYRRQTEVAKRMRVLRERAARGEAIEDDAWPEPLPPSALLQDQSADADTARFQRIELDEEEDEEEVLATLEARREARARHADTVAASDGGATGAGATDAAPAVVPLPNPARVALNTSARWKLAIRDISAPGSPTIIRDRDGTLRHSTADEEAQRSWTPRPSRYAHF